MEEDAAICTFHFLGPETSWPTTPPENYEGMEAAIDAWWTGIKDFFPASTKLVELRWYRKAAAAEHWGPPGRVTTRNVAGGQASAAPPQCALVVTEFTGVQESQAGRTVRHWGRFYLPAVGTGVLVSDGTLTAASQDTILAATTTMYEAWIDSGLKPTVRATNVGSGTGDSFVPIEELRVDNVIDTQRRRKWDTITRRVTADLSAYWGS